MLYQKELGWVTLFLNLVTIVILMAYPDIIPGIRYNLPDTHPLVTFIFSVFFATGVGTLGAWWVIAAVVFFMNRKSYEPTKDDKTVVKLFVMGFIMAVFAAIATNVANTHAQHMFSFGAVITTVLLLWIPLAYCISKVK